MKLNKNFLGSLGAGRLKLKNFPRDGHEYFVEQHMHCHASKQSANEKYMTVCDVISLGKFFAKRTKYTSCCFCFFNL